MKNSELNAYFERVGLTHSIKPDEQGLRTLHRVHLTSIPFENLDIHLGRSISIAPGAAYMEMLETHFGLVLNCAFEDFRAPAATD